MGHSLPEGGREWTEGASREGTGGKLGRAQVESDDERNFESRDLLEVWATRDVDDLARQSEEGSQKRPVTMQKRPVIMQKRPVTTQRRPRQTLLKRANGRAAAVVKEQLCQQ